MSREFAAMRRHLAGLFHGLTLDELIWTPPGTTNAIGFTLLHIFSGEDRLVQTALQGQPPLWETAPRPERVGVPALPVRGHDWTAIDLRALHPPALSAYAEAVQDATACKLSTLTDPDLETTVTIYGQPQPRAETLISISIHHVSHAGEIAALRGLQGARGRPT